MTHRHPSIFLYSTLSALVCLSSLQAADAGAAKVPGNVRSVSEKGNETTLVCEGAKVRLQFCAANTLRVSVAGLDEAFPADEPNMVIRYDWPLVQKRSEDKPDAYTISTDELVIDVAKKPLQLSFYSPGRKRLLTRTQPGKAFELETERRVSRFELDAGGATEHFYGLGLQFWRCDLRGTTRVMEMKQFFSAREEEDGRTHFVNPFFLSTAGYGIYLHSSAMSQFDLGQHSPKEYSFETPLGGLDYYFFAGPEFTKIVHSFSEVSGRMDLPPRYSLGLAYRGLEKNGTGEILLKAARIFRENAIPVDIVGTEPSWQTARGTHAWSPAFTTDPAAWVKSMQDLHLRVNLWERDEYKGDRQPGYEGCAAYSAKGEIDSLADMTLQSARDGWFAGAKKIGFDIGCQGFKVDENDHWKPASGKTMPGGMRQELYSNLHPMLVQANYHDQLKQHENKRYFGWSRGSFTGAQRYPVVGYTDAYDFQDYIRCTLNCAFWGAYFCPEYRATGDRSSERLQMMFFGPFAVDNEYISGAVPASSQGKVNPTYLKYDSLRYQLIPYIYSYYRQQNQTGIPFIRHTMMEFPNDSVSQEQDLQYFFGRDLLVAPLYDNPRQVYLPEGIWIDYWSGKRYAGGRALDYKSENGDLPLFVRSGAVVPMQPAMAYVDEKPLDPLTLLVTPGNSHGFALYEDDGISYDYEKGAYSETPMDVAMTGSRELEVKLGAVRAPGSYRPAPRMMVVKILGGGAPISVSINGAPCRSLSKEPTGSESGWWVSEERQGTTLIRVPASSEAMTIKVELKSGLDDHNLYQAAYTEELKSAKERLNALGKQSPAQKLAVEDLLKNAIAQAATLAQSPAKMAEAVSLLSAASNQARVLQAGQKKAVTIIPKDSTYLWSGSNAALNFSNKRDLLVKHDPTSPEGEIRALLTFSLADLKNKPRKVMLSIACLDSGRPLPGHDAIHAMVFACNTNIDLATATWKTFHADLPKLDPVLDYFPKKGSVQTLDVTAAVQRAMEAKLAKITFLIDSIDEMGKSAPLQFASARQFENKSKLPLLILSDE